MGEFSSGYCEKRGNLIPILVEIFAKSKSESKPWPNGMKTEGKQCLDRFYTLSDTSLPEGCECIPVSIQIAKHILNSAQSNTTALYRAPAFE